MCHRTGNKYGVAGPLNSVYMRQTIINRCNTANNIAWALAHFGDALSLGVYEIGGFNNAKLNKELCDVALLKMHIHEHMLGPMHWRAPV